MSSEQQVVKEKLKEQGYPSVEKMVELVNTDLLPFFDEHKPIEGHSAVEADKVEDVVADSGKVLLFSKADGSTLGVWKEYFLDTELWKQERLKKWAGEVY
jgi:hypothetical protein